MIEKIEELKSAISSLFDTVEINTDTVLSRENTAVIYVEGFNISFKTYHLKDIEQQVATYLPEFLPVNVVCSANGENPEEIIIRITVNGILYELIYNSRSSVLSYMNGV